MLTRLDVVRRPFAEGRTFGAVGAYAEPRGKAFFKVDPRLAANAEIVDLESAPKGADGCVAFSAEAVVRALPERSLTWSTR